MLTRTITVLGCLIIAVTAQAQRALRLDEAIDLARQRNGDLKATRTRIDQSQASIEQTRAALIPTLAVQGKYTHNAFAAVLDSAASAAPTLLLAEIARPTVMNGTPQATQLDALITGLRAATVSPPTVITPIEQLDFSASLTVPLLLPWAYPALGAAHRGKEATRASVEQTEVALLFQTAQAFFAAAGTDELVSARRHAIDVAQKTLDNARARFEAGVVNRVEVTRAEIARLRADQALREAIDQQAQGYRSLATLIHLEGQFRVVPPPDDPAYTVLPGDAPERAFQIRPEATLFRKNIDVAESQQSSAAWRWAPTVSGFGLFRAFNYTGFTGQNYNWSLGVQLDWVLYDGGVRDAQRNLADAQGRENRFRLEQLRLTISDEIANARQAALTKRKALETAMRSVKLSKETLDLVRVQHGAGTATQLDLLQAQDNLVVSEVAVAQARFDEALAILSLRRAAGVFPAK